MQSYTWYVPADEIDEYTKMKDRLKDVRIPLYFLPRTELIDSINISNVFIDNAKIGYTTIIYEDHKVKHKFCIDDNTDMGNLAIELVDAIIKENLTENQLYVVTTYYDKRLDAVLSPKLGILGTIQEDYFSAYFTGHTIRKYGYRKEDYWKNNFYQEELDDGEDYQYTKFSIGRAVHDFVNRFRKTKNT